MRVFVDTSAWISLVAAKDPHHEAVAGEWRRLLDVGARPVTSSDVVSETITFLRYRAGHQTGIDFQRLIDGASAAGRLTLIWVDEAIWKQAWQIYLTYKDHAFSMVDCTSFAICRRERIKAAISLDSHFKAVGLEVLPRSDGVASSN